MVTHKFDLNETPTKKELAKKQTPVKVRKTKVRPLLYVWVLAIVLVAFYFGIVAVNNHFDTYTYVFCTPIEIRLFKPIVREKRKPIEVLSPIVKEILDSNNLSNLDPVEQVILRVFGVQDYRVARAIAIHENNYIGRGNTWDAEAWNANNNRTIDVGIFQINSVHFNEPGCSFKELLDVEKNVECAKKIYDAQGWEPWVVYQTGSFKGSL